MSEIVEQYATLKGDTNGVEVYGGVHEVPVEMFDVGERGLLDYVGLNSLDYIIFSADDYSAISTPLSTNIFGRTLYVKSESLAVTPMVFVAPPKGVSINEECACKAMALAHELGHAEDFHQRRNFCVAPPEVKWERAEAFAHSYALKLFDGRGWTSLRDCYADALRAFGNGSATTQRIYTLASRQVGKGQITKWGRRWRSGL